MGRKAFINADSVLTCHGFVATNGTDTPLDVADDFNLEPGKWKWNGTAWIAQAPSLIPLAYVEIVHINDVAVRCFIADVKFPNDWKNYAKAIRDISTGKDKTSTSLPTRPAEPANI